jgi:two-component system chemotaxis response regulator CheY
MAKILVADDSTVMRRSLMLILTKGGHTVVGQAVNGDQACILYNQLKPDLVTMDITMPGMDGIEALSKILKSDPSAKVIMISALDQKKMILEAIEHGAKHYLVKPFKDDKVLSTVKEVLQKK